MHRAFGVSAQVSFQTTPVGFAVAKVKVQCLLNTACLTFLIAMLHLDKPKVYNLTKGDIPEGGIFIGRPSPFGNPFHIGPDGDRDTVIEKYRLWLLSQPELLSKVRTDLKGKHLVCFCSPLRCHGDILLAIANPEEFDESDW